MKTIGHLVIYISEDEDFELWRFLAQLPSDDRVSFIKTALKAALDQNNSYQLVSNSNNVFYNNSQDSLGKGDSFIDTIARAKIGFDDLAKSEEITITKSSPENHIDQKPENSRSSDSHRSTSSEDNDLELIGLDDLIQSSETTPRGLDFLLNNVIGEENDESVIAFIKNSKPSS